MTGASNLRAQALRTLRGRGRLPSKFNPGCLTLLPVCVCVCEREGALLGNKVHDGGVQGAARVTGPGTCPSPSRRVIMIPPPGPGPAALALAHGFVTVA